MSSDCAEVEGDAIGQCAPALSTQRVKNGSSHSAVAGEADLHPDGPTTWLGYLYEEDAFWTALINTEGESALLASVAAAPEIRPVPGVHFQPVGRPLRGEWGSGTGESQWRTRGEGDRWSVQDGVVSAGRSTIQMVNRPATGHGEAETGEGHLLPKCRGVWSWTWGQDI
jgi:hypothetical protein